MGSSRFWLLWIIWCCIHVCRRCVDLCFCVRWVYTREYGRWALEAWVFASAPSPRFTCWTLIPSAMVVGGGSFRTWVGYEVTPAWPQVPLLEILQSSLLLCQDPVVRSPLASLEEGPHQTLNPLLPWTWSSRLQNLENKSVISESPSLWYSLQQPGGLRHWARW